MTTAPPSTLTLAFDRWDGAGRPAALPSSWLRDRWERRGIAVPVGLGPESVTREVATQWAAQVSSDDIESMRDAFIVSMVWGYGRVPYGPFRTERVMAQPGFDDHLAALTGVALTDGGVAAYRHVNAQRFGAGGVGQTYLKYLGPAFGTKYIYLLTRAHPKHGVTPVLDEVVRRWFATHAADIDVRIGYRWENADAYARYVETLTDWADRLGSDLAPDDIEHLIFAEQQSKDGGDWQEDWLPKAPPMSVDQLLTMLSEQLVARGLEERAEAPLAQIHELLDTNGA